MGHPIGGGGEAARRARRGEGSRPRRCSGALWGAAAEGRPHLVTQSASHKSARRREPYTGQDGLARRGVRRVGRLCQPLPARIVEPRAAPLVAVAGALRAMRCTTGTAHPANQIGRRGAATLQAPALTLTLGHPQGPRRGGHCLWRISVDWGSTGPPVSSIADEPALGTTPKSSSSTCTHARPACRQLPC